MKNTNNSIKARHLLAILLLACLPQFSVAKNQKNGINSNECIILVHGLARTSHSFSKMAVELKNEGYNVVNLEYPSRKHPIEKLSKPYLSKAIDKCHSKNISKIHFVSHSMGGILIRQYLSQHPINKLGNIVMLSPPNQGSEIVDKLGSFPGFFAINGPAGLQLETNENSLPNKLGAVDYPLGIITGNKSINLILSMLIPGEDDGKVSVKRAKVAGMKDFLVVPHSHPFIMNSDIVISQVKYFLRFSTFKR